MISVVIPAHNAIHSLPICLAALQRQTCAPDEIIVVDDGSTDGTAEVPGGFGAHVLRQACRGPAAARNVGVGMAQGDLVLFTDADCEPAPDWVENMVQPLADRQVVGVKGTYRTRQRQLIARLTQAEFDDKYARMRQLERVDFIDTYSAAYRRETFLQVGGFNEAFPSNMSAEDVELSFRLAEQGMCLKFAPGAYVWHTHPVTLAHYLQRKVSYGYWRALLYLWHPGKIRGDSHTDPMLKIQFALVALAGLSSLMALANGRWLGLILAWGAGLLATTIPFAVRTRRHDWQVALVAMPVHALRAIVQAGALAFGLLVHGSRLLLFGSRQLPDPDRR